MYGIDIFAELASDLAAAKEEEAVRAKLVELGWTPPAEPDEPEPRYNAGSVWQHNRGSRLVLVQVIERGGFRSFLVNPDSGRVWQGLLWTKYADLTLDEVRSLSFGAISYEGPCLSAVLPAGCDC